MTIATLTTHIYDSFTGPDLDPSKWVRLEYPMADGSIWTCAEPDARTTVTDGELTVEVPEFRIAHGVQLIDNCKYVLLSTASFPIPHSGKALFSADLSARGINASGDYRDGFVTLGVIEPGTGLVFDVALTGERVLAIHERLPLPGGSPKFARMVEDPLAGLSAEPGASHHAEISINRGDRTVEWRVDGTLILDLAGIDLPAAVHLVLGIFTLQPLVDEQSRSLRGQGIKAAWRNVTSSVPTRTASGDHPPL